MYNTLRNYTLRKLIFAEISDFENHTSTMDRISEMREYRHWECMSHSQYYDKELMALVKDDGEICLI